MTTEDKIAELLAAVVLGPEDRLVLCVRDRPDSFALAQHVREGFPELAGRIYVVANADPIVLRATKAEGSTVGQCDEACDVGFHNFETGLRGTKWVVCHLAAGHTGLHSDGEATWPTARIMHFLGEGATQ